MISEDLKDLDEFVTSIALEENNPNWIQGAIKHPGAFKKKAQRAGMPTLEFARKVISDKENYNSRTVKQAYLALKLMSMRNGK